MDSRAATRRCPCRARSTRAVIDDDERKDRRTRGERTRPDRASSMSETDPIEGAASQKGAWAVPRPIRR